VTIEYVSGNLLESHAYVLVNPVNCQGIMGAGLAREFKEKYPDMFRSYFKYCMKEKLRIGKLFEYREGIGTDKCKIIVCFPTKVNVYEPSKLEYIEKGLVALIDRFSEIDYTIALPKLGCGLGGLNWKDVNKLFKYYLADRGLLKCFVYGDDV